MNNISSREIRSRFLNFFQSKDHLLINDSSIVPKNDPTLLFINSGMAPLKKFFTGEENPPSPRLCNVQPCIRTIDIDEIGDKHHLTSFQMLGSWSINNYFKEKAIKLAYEFLTKDLKIPNEKLYVTVFSGDEELGLDPDEEAKKYWVEAGIDEDHVVKCGKDDNFWGPTSDVGPCGPCTEVFYDTGTGMEYKPGGKFDTKKRYIEIWNAGVFMQLNKNSDGTYSKLSFTSVDTGAGLERLSMVLNNCSSVYDTDLLCPIKEKIYKEINNKGDISEKDTLIMTDHLRTSVLILSEKVKPSNEGRGYIPRKLIRKCILIINKAKVSDFNFDSIIEFIVDSYCDMYPKFKDNREYILNEFRKEYEQFSKVLTGGLQRLNNITSNGRGISGEEAFELVTTFGLPVDIIKDFCKENSILFDENGYNEKLRRHKEISRNEGKNNKDCMISDEKIFNSYDKTAFCGYDSFKSESRILGIVENGISLDKVKKGKKAALILAKTCMYAESGGQCSDNGYIYNKNFKFHVEDVKKTKEKVFVHIGELEDGEILLGDQVHVELNVGRRKSSANSHTAVHLLHSALRKLFGNDLHQSGSKIEECKLRFDFNYDKQITESDIFNLEEIVNTNIRDNIELNVEQKDINQAIKEGAMALFDSKYGDKVRVVTFGDVSKELCGGTHTSRTGNIGLFVIVSTEGIGKGIKRISALTGEEAIKYIHNQRHTINEVSKLLKVRTENVLDKLEKQLSKNDDKDEDSNKFIHKLDVKYFKSKDGIDCAHVLTKNVYKYINDDIINIADNICGVVLCMCGTDKKRMIVASSNKINNTYKANEILKGIIDRLGGKGGGSPRIASGGIDVSSEKFIDEVKNYFC